MQRGGPGVEILLLQYFKIFMYIFSLNLARPIQAMTMAPDSRMEGKTSQSIAHTSKVHSVHDSLVVRLKAFAQRPMCPCPTYMKVIKM